MIIHTMLEMMPQIASREVRDVDSRDEKRGVCEVVEDRRKHAGSRRPRALLQSAPVALQRGGWRRDGPCCLCSLLALDKGGKRKEVQLQNPTNAGLELTPIGVRENVGFGLTTHQLMRLKCEGSGSVVWAAQ